MIADFVSAEFGWLRSKDGLRNARRIFRPGKNRDGYFTNEDVLHQSKDAAAILQAEYPEYEHVFIFDNATTHRKRYDHAISARHMPKFTPKDMAHNWYATKYRTVNGEKIKEQCRMGDATFLGEPQALYYPADHPSTTIVGRLG